MAQSGGRCLVSPVRLLRSACSLHRVRARAIGLTVRAKVTMAGVTIGRVSNIYLDKEDFVGVVEMDIYKQFNNLSSDASAAILTAGVLGEKYIGLIQGAELDNLTDGSEIYDTQSALVLEDLIAKFLVGRVSDEP